MEKRLLAPLSVPKEIINRDSGDGDISHFRIDMNADGVKLFNNTSKGEFIPLLATIHSIT